MAGPSLAKTRDLSFAITAFISTKALSISLHKVLKGHPKYPNLIAVIAIVSYIE